MKRLQRGDSIRIRCHESDEWTPAFVAFASNTNPSSVALMFDGAVRDGRGGIIAKCLPVSIDYDAETVVSLFGATYEIEVAEGNLTGDDAA